MLLPAQSTITKHNETIVPIKFDKITSNSKTLAQTRHSYECPTNPHVQTRNRSKEGERGVILPQEINGTER